MAGTEGLGAEGQCRNGGIQQTAKTQESLKSWLLSLWVFSAKVHTVPLLLPVAGPGLELVAVTTWSQGEQRADCFQQHQL